MDTALMGRYKQIIGNTLRARRERCQRIYRVVVNSAYLKWDESLALYEREEIEPNR
jgi:hypothetical protein